MSNIKEIVTKAVIGKTKKSSKDTIKVTINDNIDNVLGCWIINHNFNGTLTNNSVTITGSYDLNIWYSTDNNTKTNVYVNNYTYNETVNVKLNKEELLTNKNEIIVRCLTSPNVDNVKVDGKEVELTVIKDLGVEIIGDMTVRINAMDYLDDYDEDDLDIDIDDNYLNVSTKNS